MSFQITDEHLRVFTATGHVLITGNPGSGKTATALQKAKWHIDSCGLKPGQYVLFLSFSRAAVSRITEKAGLDFRHSMYREHLVIQTFHSFFWDILKTHGYLLGGHHRLRVLLPYDEDALKKGREDDDPTWLEERLSLFSSLGKVSFDLFAPLTRELFEKSKTITEIYARKFPLIIIDEAQDTGTDQWGCINQLADQCRIVALADLDQQIYDYRKDVTADRVDQIISRLRPLEVSLSGRNHRSSQTEILDFARDVMNDTPRPGPYKGVSRHTYSPQAEKRDMKIRQCVGMLYAKLQKTLGHTPENVAILATWGKGVRMISNALRGSQGHAEIRHRVQFDETATYLSSRIIAFLLEPKSAAALADAATAINLMAELARAKGNRAEWTKLDSWADDLKAGNLPKRGKIIPELLRLMSAISSEGLSGNPETDWTRVRHLLSTADSGAISEIARNAEYLMAFNRGRRISGGLTQVWQQSGTYLNARGILDAAIAETQIVSEAKTDEGISVMTIHKAKSKEFDGVILFQNPHSSPFTLTNDSNTFGKSRKLLFVGITRAKYHTLILTDVTVTCPITSGFNL